MLEAIKHALGLCGDHWHPNVFTVMFSATGLGAGYIYVRSLIKNKVSWFTTTTKTLFNTKKYHGKQ